MIELIALLFFAQQVPATTDLKPVVEGMATYYTASENGPITASGELFDGKQYTCAMRKGEMGAFYLVVAPNGRSVVCRLNDRGPYAKGRVIDLSEAAMRQLHDRAGKLRVKVYKLDFAKVSQALGLG